MRIVTPRQMQEIDQRAIRTIGIPSLVLMENAGAAVVDIIERRVSRERLNISVMCGTGNNGGDGMVVGRHLSERGHEVMVYLTAPRAQYRGDAGTQLRILSRMGIPVTVLSTARSLERARRRFEESDVAVDALFGTGLEREVAGLFAEAVAVINACPGLVAAVDIPSGINGQSGLPMGASVTADVTVTLAFPKPGLLLFPGADHAGEVVVADIGIPGAASDGVPPDGWVVGTGVIHDAFPGRWENTHKGTYGHLLVCSGSSGKAGAGILAAMAALRAGAGLVTLAVPSSYSHHIDSSIPEVMTAPLPETSDGTLSKSGTMALRSLIGERDALAIGPGLSMNEETSELVRDVLSWSGFPAVVDADALNAIGGDLESLRKRGEQTVLTPHPGEMARLMGMETPAVQEDRIGTALRCSRRSNCVVVLKGARTVVASPDGTYHINLTGNPGMATAGTGDVLTGIIGALLARGVDTVTSALASVYLHGSAGDRASEEATEHGMTALDLISHMGPALKSQLGD
ncbi:MAG: NAD(P)H-hydrate dehydratase [bacterium]|nr:MAG: NAD(P)H-hydrate dehydratase [bacterium]